MTKSNPARFNFLGLEMEKNEKKIKDRIGIVLEDGCFYDELSLAEMKSIISSAYTELSEQDFKQYMDNGEEEIWVKK